MYKRRRQMALVFLLLMTVVLVAGCSPNMKPITEQDRAQAGIWDKFLVIPMSDMLDWFKDVLGNYGLSILVVTLIVRVIIAPLYWKQIKSMEALKKLQPKIKKLQEKYKNNPQQMQQEMLKLYQMHGYNPASGCLPMLIQFPILIAFYQAIVRNPHIADANFLYLQLGKPDPYFILPLLAALTTFLQFIVSTSVADNPQQAQMNKVMMWVFPVMIFVLAYNFASALSLYWVYGNVIYILQYLLVFNPLKRKLAQEGTIH
ncbi:YidC/Oxa1 family membrane protein insertase [Thermoflavimicrobium dichotomicum]|uniref:Membrane protein insertase YidC n=1 Tax=Thermoflavimicrobium dichotomicum TaxID=46223 RepID=A0A1I3KDR3_9BACL|nr:YidC/Oxa1 family membrane protein insertase [Thermoflavimicrobium dichotomicum]SFI70649.1 YidC/Oxa1 family membrane protein insertase [Thermoflavimicrobium dichotomicum]